MSAEVTERHRKAALDCLEFWPSPMLSAECEHQPPCSQVALEHLAQFLADECAAAVEVKDKEIERHQKAHVRLKAAHTFILNLANHERDALPPLALFEQLVAALKTVRNDATGEIPEHVLGSRKRIWPIRAQAYRDAGEALAAAQAWKEKAK